MAITSVFKALGDPVRLEMVQRLSDGSPYTIGRLSKGLGISRQGARKQIQVLASAKVIKLKPQGRETSITLETASLEIARKFITDLEKQWDRRLEALKEFVEK